jgi:branched-chain amino acid transport system substrate-binding protein
VQRAGTDSADAVTARLNGTRFSDFFARNAEIRSQDHRLVHDSYLVQVKTPAEMTEPEDFTKRHHPGEQGLRAALGRLPDGLRT